MPSDTILIVDDDSSVRRVVQMQLSEAGYEVKRAASGSEALRILAEEPSKLVITCIGSHQQNCCMNSHSVLPRMSSISWSTAVWMKSACALTRAGEKALRTATR